ncbi:uncharacterized protein LOC125676179 [Ostrea edulis]|uniref:uncharacterized protein LOC125676179 n=1 Tax=Ostrea edulis TaxID=37623 RepID=UPI0024AF13CE|nr:uncharacterized protein LOC125676179 [Ostrea edulis]
MWSICEKSVNFLDEKKLNYQSVDEVPDSLCDTFLENIHASEEDIQYVESHTYGQSDNSNWHVARKGMITASNFKKCIQTYCGYGDRRNVGHDTDTVDRRTVGNDTDTVDRRNPVILIASHKDKAEPKTYATTLAFFETLKKCIPQQQALEDLLSPDRYYEVECPEGPLTATQKDLIGKVKKCIVQTVQRLPHWGEEIPLSWVGFEDILKQKKAERVWKTSIMSKMKELQYLTELEIGDMLRFFHEIGQIIYFADDKLKDVIIIDVQWFVDGFKNIITD